MLKQFERQLAPQGIDLPRYYELTSTTEEDLRQDIWSDAEQRVKVNFMLEKIIEEKGIEVTDEEIDNKINEVATNLKIELDEAKQRLVGVMDDLIFNLKAEKAVQYLVDSADVVENDTTEEDSIVEEEAEKE